MPQAAAVESHRPSMESAYARLPWVRVAVLMAVVFATSLAGLEASWRKLGHRPHVSDSVLLWAYHRSRIVGGDSKVIVAIGTSRVRADLSPDVIAETFPRHQFVQLGINGASSSVGLLTEIAEIPGFRGTILCDVLPPLLEKRRWDEQAEFYAERIPKLAAFNAYVYCQLCDHLVVVNSATSLRECLGAAAPRFGAEPNRFHVHADRSEDFDAAFPSQAAQAQTMREYQSRFEKMRKYRDLNEFRDEIAPLVHVVARIRNNGGQVIFLRLPAGEQRLQVEEAGFPSEAYFRILADVTSAHWIDFRGVEGYPDFDCPDGSHLSPSGARKFSKGLVAALKREGLMP
jgi:hypothetical protein